MLTILAFDPHMHVSFSQLDITRADRAKDSSNLMQQCTHSAAVVIATSTARLNLLTAVHRHSHRHFDTVVFAVQAVIGAGAAGLVAARELVQEGHHVTIFEKGSAPGGVWVYTDEVEAPDLLGKHIHSHTNDGEQYHTSNNYDNDNYNKRDNDDHINNNASNGERSDITLHFIAQVLGVCGSRPVLLGWLVQSIMEARWSDVGVRKVRQDSGILDAYLTPFSSLALCDIPCTTVAEVLSLNKRQHNKELRLRAHAVRHLSSIVIICRKHTRFTNLTSAWGKPEMTAQYQFCTVRAEITFAYERP